MKKKSAKEKSLKDIKRELGTAEIRALETSVDKAVHLISEKKFFARSVSDALGIERTKIRRAKKAIEKGRRAGLNGRPTNLTDQQEQELVDWLIQESLFGRSKSKLELKSEAERIYERSNGFKKFPSSWSSKFAARHPEVKLVFGSELEDVRRKNCTADKISSWFRDNMGIFRSTSPELLWNMDETMISESRGKYKVFGATEQLHVYKGSGVQMNEHLTMVSCVSAAGMAMTPLICLKNDSIPSTLSSNSYPFQSFFKKTASGWINKDAFREWIQEIFFPELSEVRKQKQMLTETSVLLLDGHHSHTQVALELKEDLKKNNVIVLVLPPHTSHVLQPLDCGVFAELKGEFRRRNKENSIPELLNFNLTSIAEATRKRIELITKFLASWKRVAQISTIVQSWGRTGIYPFNPTHILQKGKVFYEKETDLIWRSPENIDEDEKIKEPRHLDKGKIVIRISLNKQKIN